MYFVFVINDIPTKNQIFAAKSISDRLLQSNCWAFNERTPNLRKIKPEDKVVLYIAGKDNMYFCATFKIDSDVFQRTFMIFDSNDVWLDELFPLSCGIKEINIFSTPVNVREIKDRLNFISDKKNWGLFFRQSTKVISEDDYNLITRYAYQ